MGYTQEFFGQSWDWSCRRETTNSTFTLFPPIPNRRLVVMHLNIQVSDTTTDAEVVVHAAVTNGCVVMRAACDANSTIVRELDGPIPIVAGEGLSIQFAGSTSGVLDVTAVVRYVDSNAPLALHYSSVPSVSFPYP